MAKMWLTVAKARLVELVEKSEEPLDKEALDVVLEHLGWLGQERDSLLHSGYFED